MLLALLLYAFSSVANEMHNKKTKPRKKKTLSMLLRVDTFSEKKKKTNEEISNTEKSESLDK